MDLGTATLFDLPAPAADEVLEAAPEQPMSRSEELLAEIRQTQTAIIDLEISKVRQIAAWAAEHVVGDEADACTLPSVVWTPGCRSPDPVHR